MRGTIGVILASLALAQGDHASAAPRHHHPHVRRHAVMRREEFRERVSADVIQPYRPIVGTWRYKLLEPHCDDSYPMMESSCGTATGGPVGGMGS